MTIPSSHVFPGAVVYEHDNWGYPFRGNRRRVPPQILEGAHITGNAQLPSALAEMQYSARAGSGASFTFCINRNGTVVQGFDPFFCAPWTNGDLKTPDLTNPIIKSMVGSVYNPNEFCLFTVEHVGYEPGSPLTQAQLEASGRIAKWASDVARREFGWSLPVDRTRVIGHRQINSVTRYRCPTGGDLLALKDKIIATATGGTGPGSTQEDDMNARPPKFWRKAGRVTIPAGVEFNLFQYQGQNADGSAKLRRFNGVKWGSDTAADVIGVGGFADTAEIADGWLVSPYVYVPGSGWQTLVWWSSDPLAPPAVTWDATDDGVDAGDVTGAARAVRDAGIAALTAKAKEYGA